MKYEEVFIKEMSPFLQQFLVELIREAYRARKRGDYEAMIVALSTMYHSLPVQVREDVVSALVRVAEKLGVEPEPDLIFDAVRSWCADFVASYTPPQRRDAKEAECRRRATAILTTVLSAMLAAMHKHNIFVVTKVVQGTVYRGGET